MKIKTLIPSLIFGLSSVLYTSCSKTSHKAAVKVLPPIEKSSKFNEILADTFSRKLSDETKIIAYNKLLQQYKNAVSNYIIIDKKNCQAKVYTPEGNVIYRTEIVLGRDVGDCRAGGYKIKGAQLRTFTTPGEFTISQEGSRNKSDLKLYGKRVLVLTGDHTQNNYKKSQILALHQVPTSPMGQLRKEVFNNGKLSDNRVSFGCVNLLPESFDKLRKFITGVGTKVYILPEEKGNSLYLEKLPDGQYKFFQKKYRYESQEPKTVKQETNNINEQIVKTDTLILQDTIKLEEIHSVNIINPDSISEIRLADSIKIPD